MHNEHLMGLPAAAGLARGRVRLVNGRAPDVEKGDILVLHAVDPGMIPAIERAGALLLDAAQVQTSGVIVAREFKIPAVLMRDPHARLAEGDVVEVDGHAGTVRVLELSAR